MENNEELTNRETTNETGQTSTEDTSSSDTGNEQEETPTIPDGFDEETYDLESKSLKIDGVKKRFESYNTQIDGLKKQALDLRRKLSKGHEVPDSIDKYEYIANEKYDKYFLDDSTIQNKHVQSVMNELSKLSLDNGLTKEQSKSVKDFMLDYMDVVKVIDTRSKEDIEKEEKKELMKQKEILGDDFEQIISDNLSYYKERGPFNKQEREILLDSIKKSGHVNNILMKMRKYIDGTTTFDLPTDTNVDASVERLRDEYNNPKTTDKRREQIVIQAVKEGWEI